MIYESFCDLKSFTKETMINLIIVVNVFAKISLHKNCAGYNSSLVEGF